MKNLFPILHAATDTSPSAITEFGQLASRRREKSVRALADELPYLHCGEFNGFGPLHLLSDDTLGFAFTLPVPVVDTVLDGELAVSNTVLAMLHALSPDIQWQWFLMVDSDVETSLAQYGQQSGHDTQTRTFTDAFVTRWRNAQSEGFFPGQTELNFHPRSQRIAVAIKSPPVGLAQIGLREHARAAMALARRPKVDCAPASGAERRINRFVGVVRDVLAAVQAHGWDATPVAECEFVRWLETALFPQRRHVRSPDSWRDDAPLVRNEIRTAIASLGRIVAITPGGFQTIAANSVRHHRVVSMLWQPRGVAPGLLNSLPSLRPNMNICIAASAKSPTTALLQLKARALLNARSTHRFNETEMLARTEALQEVEQRLFTEGERILDLRLQIHLVEAGSDEADEAAAVICKHLEGLEMEAAVETDIGSSLLLRGCLPFAVYPLSEQKFRRRRRMLSRDCADIHPGGGAWRGIPPEPAVSTQRFPRPIVMYGNAHGEPLFIDPTKAEKNPHALVVGQSGSGKSFFVHDYLLHLWRLPDVRIFLISIKADYRKLAILLGRYIEVGLDSEISLNPFCGAPTNENQARWFAALELMLTEGDPEQHLPRETEVLLQSAALSAAQRNWAADTQRPVRETVLEHICLELERHSGTLGRQLTAKLYPYRKGLYRRLFNAPRGVQPSDRFIFFNLGHILGQPCAALASFCVFGLIDETMTDPALRAVPKGLVADEVWALVRNAHAAAILERSLKAYRSLGGFAIPVVQDPQDLDTPAGRVMLVNTATKIILPMDAAGQADIQRYVRLNEREMEIVRNLRLVKRRFSEFFVSIDGMRSAKGLLIPDPLRYAIATTDPEDEFRIEEYFRESHSMLAALERFAMTSPFGVSNIAHAARA